MMLVAVSCESDDLRNLKALAYVGRGVPNSVYVCVCERRILE